jgi:aminoglycoside phosphotransferase (APT) family kinase protein
MYSRLLSVPRLLRSGLSSGADFHDPNLFFRYTTGRWLDNETDEQQRRYLAFDIDGLKAAAVAAVEGAKSVLHMTKLPEGSYSKVFSMTLDNRQEVIARLPTPHAGPAHLVTASEVATMEFARKRLGLPVPRVLSWSSAQTSNVVGAEFIIMEKASGIEVFKVWPQLSELHRLRLIDEIVKIEKGALENPLPCYGSIFFRSDVEPKMAYAEVDETFVIGPSLDMSFWSDERETMDIDRGPCEHNFLSIFSLLMILGSEPTEYLSALCRSEQQWIQLHASSQALHPFRHHPPITREPSAHLAVLDLFRSVIPNIIPFGSPKLVQPTLWHHDLSGSNIFISETELAQGRISITSVIDWQNTSVGPLYTQACVPRLFRYHAPWNLPDELEIAALPEDIEDMSQDAQKAARDDVAAKNMVIYYRAAVKRHAPYYYHVLTHSYTLLFAALAQGASSSWGGMFHIVRTVPPCHRSSLSPSILDANLIL